MKRKKLGTEYLQTNNKRIPQQNKKMDFHKFVVWNLPNNQQIEIIPHNIAMKNSHSQETH